MRLKTIVEELKTKGTDRIAGYYSAQGLVLVNKDTHEYIIYQKY